MQRLTGSRIFCAGLLATIAPTTFAEGQKHERAQVEAPFPMDSVTLCTFPDKDFVITRYGAEAGGKKTNTQAIAQAIDACNRAGGGRVIIPEGEWLTGPIHLKSNVNLHLEEGATVRFTDNPADYLPAVMVSWEGLECYNYSPLVYAFGCENIAITGKGTLAPKMGTWRVWFQRPKAHLDALAQLYSMGSTDVPVEYRQMARGENHLRPHLIHFNRCNRVMLDGFKIRESPFWTIHPLYSRRVLIDSVTIINPYEAPNTDGIDIESSEDVTVRNSFVFVGDDGIAIKSGSGADGIADGRPCRNVRIIGCNVKAAHGGAVIGSETAGEISGISVEDCVFDGTDRGIRIKSRRGRGGCIHGLRFRNLIMRGNLCPLVINMYYRCGADDEGAFSLEAQPVTEATPELYDVDISECHAIDSMASAGMLVGLPERPVRNLSIRRCTFAVRKGTDTPVSESDMYRGLPDPPSRGLRIRNAEVHMEDVEVSCEGEKVIIEDGVKLI